MDPGEAGKGLELSPLPTDIPANAPILNDIEAGYNRESRTGFQDSVDERSRKSSDRIRKGSVVSNSGKDRRKGSVVSVGTKGEGAGGTKKEHGSGLTEGDQC